jgi:hypothetical protein
MRLPLITSLLQERLVGEQEVVKEIETFGNVSYPYALGGYRWARRM